MSSICMKCNYSSDSDEAMKYHSIQEHPNKIATPPTPSDSLKDELEVILKELYHSYEGTFRDSEHIEPATQKLLTLISDQVIKARYDELERTRHIIASHIHELDELYATLNRRPSELQGLSNKEKGDV